MEIWNLWMTFFPDLERQGAGRSWGLLVLFVGLWVGVNGDLWGVEL